MSDDKYRLLDDSGNPIGETVELTVDFGETELCVICLLPGTPDDPGIEIKNKETGEVMLQGYAHMECAQAMRAKLLEEGHEA